MLYLPLDRILHGYIIDTIEQTANNYSSMYQDVKYQRHTEIDYITQAIYYVGHQSKDSCYPKISDFSNL